MPTPDGVREVGVEPIFQFATEERDVELKTVEITNKMVWASIVLFLLGHLHCEAAKEDNSKNSLLIQKYETDYNQTLKIEDFGDRLFQCRMIATNWSKDDVNSAFDWANKPSISVDSSARFEMLVATVSELTRKNPMKAWEKVKEISDKGERDSLSGLVIQIWAGENYAAAEKWVAQQQDSKFRNNLSIRLLEGNKEQKWQDKLARLSEAPTKDFVPILNLLNNSASDEDTATWVLSLPLGGEIRHQLLGHLNERLSSWAEENPEEAIRLLNKQDYDKETDLIWIAAIRKKLQTDPIVSIQEIKTYPDQIRNVVVKGNLGYLVKQDPKMVLHWATREQGSDKSSLDVLVELQKVAKEINVNPETQGAIQKEIQETQDRIDKNKKPTLGEIWAFVLQKAENPELGWGKLDNLNTEQKKAIDELAKQIRASAAKIFSSDQESKKFFEKLLNDPNNMKNSESPTNPK